MSLLPVKMFLVTGKLLFDLHQNCHFDVFIDHADISGCTALNFGFALFRYGSLFDPFGMFCSYVFRYYNISGLISSACGKVQASLELANEYLLLSCLLTNHAFMFAYNTIANSQSCSSVLTA